MDLTSIVDVEFQEETKEVVLALHNEDRLALRIGDVVQYSNRDNADVISSIKIYDVPRIIQDENEGQQTDESSSEENDNSDNGPAENTENN